MRRVVSVWLVLLACAGTALYAQHQPTPSGLSQHGPYWVETIRGFIVAGDGASLRIETNGPVSFEEDAGGNLAYVLRKRVTASSEAEARRLLGTAELRTWKSGEWIHLALEAGARPIVSGELEVRPPRQLRRVTVTTRFGGLVFRTVPGALTAFTGGGAVTVDRVVGPADLRTGGGEVRLGFMEGTLRASTASGAILLRNAGGEADLSSGGGGISVQQAAATLRAVTAAGNIEVARAEGAVEARTQGGIIRVTSTGREVVAESGGGAIVIDSARGVDCQSQSGTVKLTRVSGSVNVVAAMGSILAQWASGSPLAESQLSTAGGDITVLLPSNQAVTVEAVAESRERPGKIITEFSGVRVEGSPGGAQVLGHGALNGGGPVLRVAARDGVISLRRQSVE